MYFNTRNLCKKKVLLDTGVKKKSFIQTMTIFYEKKSEVLHITLKCHPGYVKNEIMRCIFFAQNKELRNTVMQNI